DAAVASHKISAETGNVYKVFALFADPQLPPEFRGGSAGINESMLIDLKPQLGSMSTKARSQLAPFYIPPYHAGSWWAARERAADRRGQQEVLPWRRRQRRYRDRGRHRPLDHNCVRRLPEADPRLHPPQPPKRRQRRRARGAARVPVRVLERQGLQVVRLVARSRCHGRRGPGLPG